MTSESPSGRADLEARTRQSLILRLHDWKDQRSWDEFYRSYHKLIFAVARQSGLNEEEAWDVVQETIITVAKQSKEKVYDPGRGSFKAWLLRITQWRIEDQRRNRGKEQGNTDMTEDQPEEELHTDTHFEQLWEKEWQENVMRAALARVKLKVSPRQFQIFDFNVLHDMDAAEVRRRLGVSAAQVYLAKHRVGAALRRELEELQRQER